MEIGPSTAHWQWSKYEATLSSTWRELKAVSLVLDSFAARLAGHRVKWFTNNQNVVRIVEAGSKKQHLQSIALSIFVTYFRQDIRLDMEWIPRSRNDKADYITRIRDYVWTGKSILASFLGLMQCWDLVLWTVLPMSIILSSQCVIADSGAQVPLP